MFEVLLLYALCFLPVLKALHDAKNEKLQTIDFILKQNKIYNTPVGLKHLLKFESSLCSEVFWD